MKLTLKYGQQGAIILDMVHFLQSEKREVTFQYLQKSTRLPMFEVKQIVQKMEYEGIIEKGTVK